MIKWWIVLIIGALTMVIGYLIGFVRAQLLYKMIYELLDEVDERMAELTELSEEVGIELERQRRTWGA